MTLPDLPVGGEIIFGGISWSILVTLLISFISRYKPMTEQNIQLLKGLLSALGYVVVTFLVNAPQYTSVVMFVIMTLLMFLTSSGVYDIGKNIAPNQLTSTINAGERNRGM